MSIFLNLSLGYIKDLLATIVFAIIFSLILFKNIHKNKKLLLWLLIIAFTADLTFSLIPSLHNKKIKELF